MSQPTPYKMEIDHNRVVVTFLPDLNSSAWADIERIGTEILQRIPTTSAPRLLIDLSPLSYMASAQVALVVRIFKSSVKERGGKMVVAAHEPVVLEVLKIAGLDRIWHVVGSRSEGLYALGSSEEEEFSPTESPSSWQIQVGAVCLLVALIPLYATLSHAKWFPLAAAAPILLLAAAAGFGFGLMAVLSNTGTRRNLGAGVLTVGVFMLLAGVYALGTEKGTPRVKKSAGAAAPEEPAADAPADNSLISAGEEPEADKARAKK